MNGNKNDVYIAVGSNIEPEKNIISALIKLKSYVEIINISTFYKTKPIKRPEQPYFLNGIFHISTNIPPRKLKFEILRKIESELGRIRTDDKYAPRTIDLDIIIYDDKLIRQPDIRIPDPEIRKRSFIAIPLLELAPNIILPDTNEPLAELDIVKCNLDIKPDFSFSEKLKSIGGVQ